jgi:hypothetical protein
MKNNLVKLGLILATCVIALPAACLADGGSVSVAAPATVNQGSSFTVDVDIANAADLYDFQLDLTFDPTVLQATSVVEGSFLGAGGATFFLPGTIDNAGGSITFNADTLLTAISGVSGSGALLEFDFTALAPGVSALSIQNLILQDSTGAILDATTTDGSVTVKASSKVPEPSSLALCFAGLLSMLLVGLSRNVRTSFRP